MQINDGSKPRQKDFSEFLTETLVERQQTRQ